MGWAKYGLMVACQNIGGRGQFPAGPALEVLVGSKLEPPWRLVEVHPLNSKLVPFQRRHALLSPLNRPEIDKVSGFHSSSLPATVALKWNSGISIISPRFICEMRNRMQARKLVGQ